MEDEILPPHHPYWDQYFRNSHTQDDLVAPSAGHAAKWAAGLPMIERDSKPDLYLTSRGVGFKEYPEDLRMTEKENMVALIRDRHGAIVSFQITVPDLHDGKWTKTRKMMKSPRGHTIPCGASIRLGKEGKTMGCAEGTESALSAFKRYGVTTWSTISAPGMARWLPPYEAKYLFIYQDNGLVGGKAANALRFRCNAMGVTPIIRQVAMLATMEGIMVTDQNTLRMNEVRGGYKQYQQDIKERAR